MAPELRRKLDYSDLQATPDDGKRYELLEGELFVTPSPSPWHQWGSGELQQQLRAYFHGRKLGFVFNAPTDLILTGHDVFVPDLLVVADPSHISDRGIEKTPLLVVEILSPATRRIDLTTKARRYAELGVPHYWIVDPEARSLNCQRLDGPSYRPAVEGQGDVTLTHPDWDGLTVDLAPLWRRPGAA
jgi:Uma2 family endonuclease